jgi:hypothetical protein
MRLNHLIGPLVPEPIKAWRRKRLIIEDLLAATKPLYPRSCPLCSHHGSFAHFGRPPRLDAQCPACGCLERHRLFWLWFAGDRSKLQEPLLHFAPEPVLERKFREIYQHYSTASISGKADLQLDIENIDLPAGSLNTVICNHVLEHVSDSRALKEICRVLSGSGRLVASVPIVEGWEHTYENESIADPAERELHFGQSDHVRYYGRDFRDRLLDAGFNRIEEITAEGRSVVDYGLLRGEKIFVCSK